MGKIKGIPITLIDKVIVGKDAFGAPIYEDKEIKVDNVLVAPVSPEEVINQLNLTGKKVTYTLGIPKGDDNEWKDKEVLFFGQRWKTVGIPIEGIESLVPLDWHKKVLVERYE